jgi:hypothetical protein
VDVEKGLDISFDINLPQISIFRALTDMPILGGKRK